MMRTA